MALPRFFFVFCFSFLFFGFLIARASPGSNLVNDPLFGCGFAYSSSSRNRCRFARFFVIGQSFTCIMCMMGTYTPVTFGCTCLDVCSSEVFVRRRLFHSFLGVLTPLNLERARINFGSYCLKGCLLYTSDAADE